MCRTFKQTETGRMPRLLLRPGQAFTLIEMLIVITIISILLLAATPMITGAISANRLTSAGDSLLFKISLAQQTAVAQNRAVELRFYYYSLDGVEGCHACRLYALDTATNVATPLEPPTFFGEGAIVMIDGPLSPLFAGNQAPGDKGPADDEPFKSKGATFHRLVIYPDGSTNLNTPLRSAYVTLVEANGKAIDSAQVPANYYTVQIDPITGRARSYRPE